MDSEPRHRQSAGKLLRVLGLSFGLAASIGGMIGMGILRTPGTVASQLPNVWLILGIWLVGGVYSLFGAFSVAELGASIPRVGGWYAFSRRAFGEYAGFAMAWMDWVAYPASFALISITAAEYIARLFPWFGGHRSATAVAILLFFAFVNWFGLRVSGRLQEVLSFSKAAFFLFIVVAAFVIGGEGKTESVAPTVTSPLTLGAVIIALQAVIFAYDGWHAAVYFTEESRDPGRTVPKAMIYGVLSVTAIYVLLNAALLYVLPMSVMAGSVLPVADAATYLFGIYADRTITVLALLTLFSLLNANLLTGSRILFAVARDGLMTRRASEVNRGGTPATALVITVAASIPVILTGTFETLLAVTAFLFIILYACAYAAVIRLRTRESEMPRPYKAFGYPYTTSIVLIGSIAFIAGALWTDTLNSIYAVGLIACSYPLYLVMKKVGRGSSEPALSIDEANE